MQTRVKDGYGRWSLTRVGLLWMELAMWELSEPYPLH